MTLQQIGQYLYSLLIQVAGLVAPLAEVLRLEQISAKEQVPYHIQHQVDAIAENVVALQAAVATLSATLDLDNTAILLAISEVQQAGSPVTLPTVPPIGYASPTDQQITDDVWEGVPTGYVSSMDYPLMQTFQSVGWNNYFQLPFGFSIFIINGVNIPITAITPNPYSLPAFVETDILAGETLEACITRQNPTWIVAYGNPPATNVLLQPTDGSTISWITTVDEETWLVYYDRVYPPIGQTSAPVWPGLAGVTLLTPVALDIGVTIAEACSGAIIDITAVPSKQGQFALGDMTSWRNVGAIAFVDDNGEAEYPQTLGLVHGVYLAKSMAVAAGLVLRASPGVTGTVTPFTIP